MLRRRLVLALLIGSLGCNTEQPSPGSPTDAPAPADSPKPEARPIRAPSQPDLAALPELAAAPVDSPAIAQTGEVMATLQLPSGCSIDDLAPVIEGFAPGATAKARLQMPITLGELAGMKLDGAALTAPISIVVVDPNANPEPAALVVEFDDLERLRASASEAGRELRVRDRLALIGSPAVVAAVESFAFTNLAKAPDHTELVLYPAALMRSLGPMIEQGLATMPTTGPTGAEASIATMAKSMVGMTRAFGEQSGRVVISVTASKRSADIYMRVYPIAGTTLAKFVAAQVPADHALLAKLQRSPDTSAVISGRFEAGAARASMLELFSGMMREFYGSTLSIEAWDAMLADWLDALDGRVAMSVKLGMLTAPGVQRMAILMGSSDPERLRSSWRAMIEAMSASPVPFMQAMGMKMSFDSTPNALEHEGVVIDRFETHTDISAMTPQMQTAMKAAGSDHQVIHFAAFDQVGAMGSSAEDIEGLIDAVRSESEPAPLGPDLAHALAASTARGESLFYWFDFAGLMPTPNVGLPFRGVVMGMGKQGDALSLCISLTK